MYALQTISVTISHTVLLCCVFVVEYSHVNVDIHGGRLSTSCGSEVGANFFTRTQVTNQY